MQSAIRQGEGGQGEALRVVDLVTAAVLLAVGYVLHVVTPALYAGVKPDLVLGMLFIILLLYRNVTLDVAAGLAAGTITAITTSMPGGQIPNLVDKLVTTLVLVGLIRLFSRLQPNLLSIGVAVLGTLISGTAFLSTAMVLGVFPAAALPATLLAVVLPAALANAVVVAVLYPVARAARRLTGSPALQGPGR